MGLGEVAEADCIPDGMTIPELAEQVVRGKIKLSPAQQRMLIELLPFYMPKLSAVGYLHEGDTFASRLERAIGRSNNVRPFKPKLIEDLRFKQEAQAVEVKDE